MKIIKIESNNIKTEQYSDNTSRETNKNKNDKQTK